jgi:hypothetical protein
LLSIAIFAIPRFLTGKLHGERIEPDETLPAAIAGSGSDPRVERALTWLKSQPRCEQ